jgi:dephospho-CoA kinase
MARIDGAAKGAADAVIIEAIKLVEGGLAEVCDEVWLVTCDPSTQLERLVGRGSDEADAASRIATQGDIGGRLRPRATRVIDTSGDREATRQKVEVAFDEALRSMS